TDHLERHDAIQLAVARLVDRSHAALAQQFEDFVAPAQHAPGHERLSETVQAGRTLGGLRPAFRYPAGRHTAGRHTAGRYTAAARARDGRARAGGRHAGQVERRVTLRAPDGPGRVLVAALNAFHNWLVRVITRGERFPASRSAVLDRTPQRSQAAPRFCAELGYTVCPRVAQTCRLLACLRSAKRVVNIA